MNTYRVLYYLVRDKIKELQDIVWKQDRVLEEQRKAIQERDKVIDELKRKLSHK